MPGSNPSSSSSKASTSVQYVPTVLDDDLDPRYAQQLQTTRKRKSSIERIKDFFRRKSTDAGDKGKKAKGKKGSYQHVALKAGKKKVVDAEYDLSGYSEKEEEHSSVDLKQSVQPGLASTQEQADTDALDLLFGGDSSEITHTTTTTKTDTDTDTVYANNSNNTGGMLDPPPQDTSSSSSLFSSNANDVDNPPQSTLPDQAHEEGEERWGGKGFKMRELKKGGVYRRASSQAQDELADDHRRITSDSESPTPSPSMPLSGKDSQTKIKRGVFKGMRVESENGPAATHTITKGSLKGLQV